MTRRPPDFEHAVAASRISIPGRVIDFPAHARRMWRMPLPPPSSRYPAALGWWLLNCEHDHPVWSHWIVSLVHLRAMPGVPAAVGRSDGHEVLIFAVDPKTPPDPDTIDPTCTLLQPPLVFQFGTYGADDKLALERVDTLVQWCVTGQLSPDDDHRARWRQLLELPTISG